MERRTGRTVLLAVWSKKYLLQRQSHWSRSLEQLSFLSLEPIWESRLGFERGGLVVNLGKSVHTQIAPFVQRFMWGWKKEGKRTSSPTMVISHKTSSVPLLCLQHSPELCCFQPHWKHALNVSYIQRVLFMKLLTCGQTLTIIIKLEVKRKCFDENSNILDRFHQQDNFKAVDTLITVPGNFPEKEPPEIKGLDQSTGLADHFHLRCSCVSSGAPLRVCPLFLAAC